MYLEKCNLSGKSAFITGAGRGIGLATAEALAEAGARVMISDIDEGLLASGRKALAAKGFEAATHRLDVANPTAVSAAADAAVAAFGKIDVVVANAGIAWPDTGGEDMTDEVWRKVIDIDLNGSFWTCREFGRRMLASGGGSIVHARLHVGPHLEQAAATSPLQRRQSGGPPDDSLACRRMGRPRRPCELRGADLRRHANVERRV